MIIFVRHGQTDYNINHIICGGGSDIPLNETGLEQARALREKMKDLQIDVVISSTMTRAMQTAREILRDRRDVPLFLDERIIERNWNEWEGTKAFADKISVCYTLEAKIPAEFKKRPIEELSAMEKRIRDFWKDVERKFPNKNVVVVAHDGVARFSRMIFGEIPEGGKLVSLSLENAKPYILKK